MMEMANKIVADDEIENVGIMDGFMEDIEGLMDEIAEAEGMVAVGSEEDMSEIMDRRPDSPEILMNNLRGDYRSVDARREELADLVGFNAASETPDDVLALLHPVLAGQQEGVASLGALSPETMVPPRLRLQADCRCRLRCQRRRASVLYQWAWLMEAMSKIFKTVAARRALPL